MLYKCCVLCIPVGSSVETTLCLCAWKCKLPLRQEENATRVSFRTNGTNANRVTSTLDVWCLFVFMSNSRAPSAIPQPGSQLAVINQSNQSSDSYLVHRWGTNLSSTDMGRLISTGQYSVPTISSSSNGPLQTLNDDLSPARKLTLYILQVTVT